MSEPVLTMKEAAHLLNVSTRTIYRMIHDKQIEAVRVRGSYRILPEAVRKVLVPDRRSQAPPQQMVSVAVTGGSTQQRTGASTTVDAKLATLLELPSRRKGRKASGKK